MDGGDRQAHGGENLFAFEQTSSTSPTMESRYRPAAFPTFLNSSTEKVRRAEVAHVFQADLLPSQQRNFDAEGNPCGTGICEKDSAIFAGQEDEIADLNTQESYPVSPETREIEEYFDYLASQDMPSRQASIDFPETIDFTLPASSQQRLERGATRPPAEPLSALSQITFLADEINKDDSDDEYVQLGGAWIDLDEEMDAKRSQKFLNPSPKEPREHLRRGKGVSDREGNFDSLDHMMQRSIASKGTATQNLGFGASLRKANNIFADTSMLLLTNEEQDSPLGEIALSQGEMRLTRRRSLSPPRRAQKSNVEFDANDVAELWGAEVKLCKKKIWKGKEKLSLSKNGSNSDLEKIDQAAFNQTAQMFESLHSSLDLDSEDELQRNDTSANKPASNISRRFNAQRRALENQKADLRESHRREAEELEVRNEKQRRAILGRETKSFQNLRVGLTSSERLSEDGDSVYADRECKKKKRVNESSRRLRSISPSADSMPIKRLRGKPISKAKNCSKRKRLTRKDSGYDKSSLLDQPMALLEDEAAEVQIRGSWAAGSAQPTRPARKCFSKSTSSKPDRSQKVLPGMKKVKSIFGNAHDMSSYSSSDQADETAELTVDEDGSENGNVRMRGGQLSESEIMTLHENDAEDTKEEFHTLQDEEMAENVSDSDDSVEESYEYAGDGIHISGEFPAHNSTPPKLHTVTKTQQPDKFSDDYMYEKFWGTGLVYKQVRTVIKSLRDFQRLQVAHKSLNTDVGKLQALKEQPDMKLLVESIKFSHQSETGSEEQCGKEPNMVQKLDYIEWMYQKAIYRKKSPKKLDFHPNNSEQIMNLLRGTVQPSPNRNSSNSSRKGVDESKKHFVEEEDIHPWGLTLASESMFLIGPHLRAWDYKSMCQIRNPSDGFLSKSPMEDLSTEKNRRFFIDNHSSYKVGKGTPFISTTTNEADIPTYWINHKINRQLGEGSEAIVKLTLINGNARRDSKMPVIAMKSELEHYKVPQARHNFEYANKPYFKNEYLWLFRITADQCVRTFLWWDITKWMKSNNATFEQWYKSVALPLYNRHEELRLAGVTNLEELHEGICICCGMAGAHVLKKRKRESFESLT